MKKPKKPLREKYLGLDPIIYMPPYHIDKDRDEDNIFKEANDRRIVVDTHNYSPFEIVCALVVFIIFFYMCIYTPIHKYNNILKSIPAWVDDKKYNVRLPEDSDYYVTEYEEGGMEGLKDYACSREYLAEGFFFGGILCGMALYWGYVASKRCRDKVIFDRNNSTVSYRHTFGLLTTVAPFSEILFQQRMMSFYNSDYMLALRVPGTVSWAVLAFGFPETFISLYTWYMDKNRPLPPGDQFDEYREADYLRRKAEGFPMPLYYSAILTPEWQGAEEKYGDKGGIERARLMLHPELEWDKLKKKKSSKKKRR